MEIPVRMRQTRMRPVRWESPPGFKCQTQSTRLANPEMARRYARLLMEELKKRPGYRDTNVKMIIKDAESGVTIVIPF
jgi:hypothetical protein